MSRNRTPEEFSEKELRLGRARMRTHPAEPSDPRVEALVNEVIGRVADKWTMLVLEELAERGEQRFGQLGERVHGISQKMLTQTLRQMERDGLVVRTVHPVVPPHVDYRLTSLGMSLGAAFCDVWLWAEKNLDRIEEARGDFESRQKSRGATAR
jgi:DNA-binding HxlR family transcriptional regulator